MTRDPLPVFILTHGRANNQITLKTLKDCRYPGKIYLLIDDEDEQAEEYKKLDTDGVYVFCKEDVLNRIDTQDNFRKKGAIIYARNAVYDVAKSLGIKSFVMLDDDYLSIGYRRIENGKFKEYPKIDRLADLWIAMDAYLDTNPFIKTIAMAQNGDYIGGKDGGFYNKGLARKAMNAFICRTDRVIEFKGFLNEDVNTYVSDGNRGDLFFTFTAVCIKQKPTQTNSGGMTNIYMDLGTYVKSFYSVMCAPQAVKVAVMGNKDKRLHHKIQWKYCSPKIISDKWKKGGHYGKTGQETCIY